MRMEDEARSLLYEALHTSTTYPSSPLRYIYHYVHKLPLRHGVTLLNLAIN